MKTIVAVAAACLAFEAEAHPGDRAAPDAQEREGGVRKPLPPRLTAVRGLRPATAEELRLIYGRRPSFSGACAVAFDDPAALAALPNVAGEGTAGAPWWFQDCHTTAGDRAVVRPLVYSHYHLFFEDASISCLDFDTQVFGRLQPDGTCSSAGIDHAEEPRYLNPHIGDEQIHLYVVNQVVNPNDPYSDSTLDKKPFDLRRLRVVTAVPVRVCYKKVQEIEGPWITSPDVHVAGSAPGVWLCWNSLGQGLWDLSAWAFDVREVKITATDGVSVYALDDLEIGLP